MPFFFFFFLRNRCIWPHIGEVKTWALRKSSVRPQSGYLYQSDVYWKSKTLIPPTSQNQFKEERCEFCLVKYLLHREEFWCGSDFSWSTHRLYCRQKVFTCSCFSTLWIKWLTSHWLIDVWLDSRFFSRDAPPPTPPCEAAWCACLGEKGRKNLTFSLSSK